MNIVRKFGFDTVFDGDGEVLSAPAPRKAFYTPPEVEQIRQDAYAEGQRSALQQAEIDQAQCLEGIRFAIEKGMSLLAQAAPARCSPSPRPARSPTAPWSSSPKRP